MAQPDFEVIGQCLNTLGGQVQLVGNHPAVNRNAQILAAIQRMEGRLVAMEDRLAAGIAQMERGIDHWEQGIDQWEQGIDQWEQGIDQWEQGIDQMNAHIDQMNACTVKLAQTQSTNDKKSLARALNSGALNDEARLYPLPLPNGDEIPEGRFPDTLGDLRELEGAQLAWLLEAYELVVPSGASEYDLQDILATYCGIRY